MNMTPSLPVHPLADIFPGISGDEFRELVKDIKERGLLNPIVLAGGMIIDGRQRLRACIEAGVEPKVISFAEVGGDCSISEYIWSQNVTRRHLSSDQRSIIAARWADKISEMAKKNSAANLKTGDQKPERADSPTRGKAGQHLTRKAIAERAQVSEHKARQAEVVHKKAPEMEADVIAGRVKLKDAARIAPARKAVRAPKAHHGTREPVSDEQRAFVKFRDLLWELADKLVLSIHDLTPVVSELRDVADYLEKKRGRD
jgi:hypothetical protein